MRAIVQDRYGEPDVLELAEIDKPVAGPGEVLIRVGAASAFVGDWHIMSGLPYVFRVVNGISRPKVRVRGQDVAGRIEEVGPDVERFHPGDEVFGTCKGAFADYAIASEEKIAHKPANLTVGQAATVPITATTALQGLRKGRVRGGQHVLIIGAAGGVGSFAVQIAAALGAHVTGVCSTGQVDLVRSIGAEHAVDYKREDFTRTGRRYDVILVTAGHDPVARLRRALAPRGSLVIVGAEGGGKWFGGIGRQLRAQLLSPFTKQWLGTFVARQNGKDLLALKELIEAGKVTPVIDSRFALGDVPQAILHIEEGHGQGKVLITVTPRDTSMDPSRTSS
jgi:NADPH:quinone reductase-like Zn-dependent oxidoreductase